MYQAEKRCLCVITARGGSKRIPKKNIKHFLGKPIIAYSIEAAIKSELFDEVMVSTDSKEIATVARESIMHPYHFLEAQKQVMIMQPLKNTDGRAAYFRTNRDSIRVE